MKIEKDGKKREMSNCYNMIIAFINDAKGDSFTLREMCDATGIHSGTISGFLCQKKDDFSRYKDRKRKCYVYKVKRQIVVAASKGAVSNKVWEVLQRKRVVKRKDLDRAVLKGNVGRSVNIASISNTVFILFRRGYINKIGAQNVREYSLKKEYYGMERPSLVSY